MGKQQLPFEGEIMKEDISFVAKGINALPKDLQQEALELMDRYNNYLQSVALTFTDAVGEACKDLLTIAGVNVDLVSRDGLEQAKKEFNAKGFRLANSQYPNSVFTFSLLTLSYKEQFVAAVIVWLDPINDVITSRMYDDHKKAYEDVKKLVKGVMPHGTKS